jgi:hypothetical protein
VLPQAAPQGCFCELVLAWELPSLPGAVCLGFQMSNLPFSISGSWFALATFWYGLDVRAWRVLSSVAGLIV